MTAAATMTTTDLAAKRFGGFCALCVYCVLLEYTHFFTLVNPMFPHSLVSHFIWSETLMAAVGVATLAQHIITQFSLVNNVGGTSQSRFQLFPLNTSIDSWSRRAVERSRLNRNQEAHQHLIA